MWFITDNFENNLSACLSRRVFNVQSPMRPIKLEARTLWVSFLEGL